MSLIGDFFAAFYGFQVLISILSRKIREFSIPLHATDRLLIAFWCLLSLVTLILQARIPEWGKLVAYNLAAIVVACALAHTTRAKNSKLLRAAHDWAAFPMVLFTYKQVYFMIASIHHGKDYDHFLMALDRALFRINPTEWLDGLSNPLMTEILQIAYSLFYVFFIAVGMELYWKEDLRQFRIFRFTVVYGFLISYVGYFFLPAVGPRFTLHDFSAIDVDLPGLLLTPFLRLFVNFFESIPAGVSNAVAFASAQRDAFPSGHTMMTLIAVLMAYRFRLRIRHAVLGMGTLLIFATVYLRYHYVVDVAAGAILVIPCLLTSTWVNGFFRNPSSAAED